jgi:uncharacterized protein (TIGR00369 family)
MPEVTTAELNALLAAHPFTRGLGATVTRTGEGEVTLEIPYRPENDRPGGMVGGHVYMLAADVAFWFAIKTRLGLDDTSVTSTMSTTFLESARRESITCVARVLRLGGRLIYGVAECSVGARLLTHHTLTYARPRAGTSAGVEAKGSR